MSLLNRANETVIVYPEELYIDSDGNRMTRPSLTGLVRRVMIQPLEQSGTSARRAEQDNEGFESEEVYRMRFTRANHVEIGPQGRIDWKGQYWAVMGEPRRFNGSPRTRHIDYTIRRT